MGRWRPPRPASSPYITREGYAALQAELADLWPRRREVVAALAAAAAEGDRSENAEYVYRKKELAGIDSRIRYLQKRLPALQVVAAAAAADRVYFGAWVSLQDADGDDSELQYRIVGADESDGQKGWISVDSPMARALLGIECGQDFELEVAGRTRRFVVTAVRYASETTG